MSDEDELVSDAWEALQEQVSSLEQALREAQAEIQRYRDWRGDSLGAVMHRDDAGQLTLEWPQGEEVVPVSRLLVEQIVEQMNETSALTQRVEKAERERERYQKALERIADGPFPWWLSTAIDALVPTPNPGEGTEEYHRWQRSAEAPTVYSDPKEGTEDE